MLVSAASTTVLLPAGPAGGSLVDSLLEGVFGGLLERDRARHRRARDRVSTLFACGLRGERLHGNARSRFTDPTMDGVPR